MRQSAWRRVMRLCLHGSGKIIVHAADYVGKTVIDIAVMGFVIADDQHNLAQGRARRHIPIKSGDFGCRYI